jgi:hypothetical protein
MSLLSLDSLIVLEKACQTRTSLHPCLEMSCSHVMCLSRVTFHVHTVRDQARDMWNKLIQLIKLCRIDKLTMSFSCSMLASYSGLELGSQPVDLLSWPAPLPPHKMLDPGTHTLPLGTKIFFFPLWRLGDSPPPPKARSLALQFFSFNRECWVIGFRINVILLLSDFSLYAFPSGTSIFLWCLMI